MKYLSKSDFKAARECSSKLYYRKNKYPNSKQDDEFMQLLAEGGFMVGKLAQLLFPGGIEITGGRGKQEAAIAATKEYLKQENVVLFEPAIYVDGFLIRADILIKRGKRLELVEVKAKSIEGAEIEKHDSGGTSTFWKKRGKGLDSKWQSYLEDVAFQTLVLQRAFPDADILPSLMLCDKSQHTTIDNLLQQFVLRVVRDDHGNESSNVEYTGDVEALRKDLLLIRIPVQPEVEHLLPEITEAAEEFVASVMEDRKIPSAPCTDCKKCEYRLPLTIREKNGFVECWGRMADESPHLLDLNNLGNVTDKGEKLADALFAKGRASLYDIPLEWLTGEKRGVLQKRQIEYTRKGEEWISPELQAVLQGYVYPLHFIDFETSRMALPYHAGMRPYGQVAFQWSCHTIDAPGLPPRHREWINTHDTYPNIEFAQSLMDCLGRSGTVFTWSHHERSVLRDIADTMRQRDAKLLELSDWLEWVDSKFIDQCKIAAVHYYHPHLKGSFSIKRVLPAVWNNHRYLHDVDYFKPYYRETEGCVISPYKTLDTIDIAETAEVIDEGTGAMRAYQAMMYGLYRGDFETHKKWTELLLQYCALDTMAMVIIYKHWCVRSGIEL